MARADPVFHLKAIPLPPKKQPGNIESPSYGLWSENSAVFISTVFFYFAFLYIGPSTFRSCVCQFPPSESANVAHRITFVIEICVYIPSVLILWVCEGCKIEVMLFNNSKTVQST